MNGTFVNARGDKLTLTDEQQMCLDYSGDRTLVVKAYAGGGKSTVIQGIAKKYIEEFYENYDPRAYNKVIVLTYNKPLASATSQLLGINGDGKRRFIKCKTVNKHLYDICVDIGLDRNTVCDERTQIQFIRNALADYREKIMAAGRYANECRVLNRNVFDDAFWKDEIEWIKGMNVTTADEDYYMTLTRVGRDKNIVIYDDDKKDIFGVFCCYRHILKKNGMVDWEDFALYVARHADQVPLKHKYEHVLIDEAQDLSLAQMKALLNVVGKDLAIGMDQNQKLYNKQWEFVQLGLDIEVKELTKSLRTTAEIDTFAESFRRANTGSEEKNHPIPQWHGPKPTVVLFKNIEDEKNFLLNVTESWRRDYPKHTIGIIASKNAQLDNISAWLKDVDIPKEIIRGDQSFKITEPGVKLVTTHSAKGLEFARVIIPQFVNGNYPYSYMHLLKVESERKAFEVRERNRAYVAMTRAQLKLVITCVKGEESPFLKDIDPDCYELIDRTTGDSEGQIEVHSAQQMEKSEEQVENQDLEEFKKVLSEVLSSLKDREERIIRLRFGLEDGKTHTLEEIGSEFGVTRERIRQIEMKALRKLRHPARKDRIKPYVDPDLDILDILKRLSNNKLIIKSSEERAKDAENELKRHNIVKPEDVNDDLPIEQLGLTNRSYNCLKRAHINTVGELTNMTFEDLNSLQNLGRKSIHEIIALLEECGLSLKVSIPENSSR